MPIESSKSQGPEIIPNSGLAIRLNNWINERPLWLFGQRVVRKTVANAIITDTLYPISASENPARLIKYRRWVNDALVYSIEKLQGLPSGNNGFVRQSSEQKDSVSKEPFHTEIIRESDSWVSREKDDRRVISEARLFDDGRTAITLNYQGERFDSRNANPCLVSSADHPTGAKVLFLNHTASLGIIGWGRKTKKEIERHTNIGTARP